MCRRAAQLYRSSPRLRGQLLPRNAGRRQAEAVAQVTASHVSDAVYADVRPHFNDRELSDLTLAVAAIDAWNRLSIAARLVPGNYQPATSAV